MDKVILQAFLDDDSSDDELEKILEAQNLGYSLLLNNEVPNAAISLLEPLCDLMDKPKRRKCRASGCDYVEKIVPHYSDKEFMQNFRMKRSDVQILVNRLVKTDSFTKLTGHGGLQPICADTHILAFLWFVSHKFGSYREASERFNMSVSSLHDIVGRTSDFLTELGPEFIKWPSASQQEATADYFKTKHGVPNVIGCIGGNHIRIDKHGTDNETYINSNGYHSVFMQAIVNENLKFLDVFIGYPGSAHGARVFHESPIFSIFNDLFDDDTYILGDSTYPCLPNLMVPYRDNGHLRRSQKQFNSKISECLEVVDNAFRCVRERFPQLHHFKGRDKPRIVKLIQSCCVLHNLASLDDLQMIDDSEDFISNDEEHVQITNTCPEIDFPFRNTGRKKRDELCRYLLRSNEQILEV